MRRRVRGGATVELAISMIVLIPIFLYALFLDDLLRYRLDLQEAVVSSPWDFTTQSYQPSAPALWDVQHFNRLSWCDHTSAYNSFDESFECEDQNHHQAVGAHVCWLTQGSKQVTCQLSKNEGKFAGLIPGAIHEEFNRGGFYQCSARVAVLNYLLPQTLFSEFSQTVMTDRKKMSGAVHSEGSGAAAGDVYLLDSQEFGLVTDTWALNTTQDRTVAEDGLLYDRVNKAYTTNPQADAPLKVFALLLSGQKELLSPALLAWWDDPSKPNVSILHGSTTKAPPPARIEQEGGQGSYHATPWKDWSSDEHEATWNGRGGYYMGNVDEAQP
ncbi:MAG: hypothetical protein ACOZIN_20010 [Myxococcota bacterium]